MFDAKRGQIISPDEAVLADDTSALLPLRDLLMADELPFKKGDFEKPDPKLWDKERFLEVGKLVLATIEQDGERWPITTEHLGRMATLGLAAGSRTFRRYFDDFTIFKQEIGSPIRYDRLVYAEWGTTDLVQYAKDTMKELSHLPRIVDYGRNFDQGKGPSYAWIEDRVKNVGELNECLGYPNTRNWDKADFLDWGVNVMTANPGKDFSLNIVAALAADGRGPGRRTISEKYGKWVLFREDVENEFRTRPKIKQQERDAKLNRYQSMLERGIIPPNIMPVAKNRLLAAGARYIVIQDCAPDLIVSEKREICRTPINKFIRLMLKSKPNLTAGYIEMVADSHGVFDDIWPLDGSVKNFHVSQKRIDGIRLAKNLVQAQLRAKRKAHRAA